MVTTDVLNSPALPVLLHLESAGVRFRLEGERVLVWPCGAMTFEQRDVLRRHQAAVRVLVNVATDAGVQARRDTFRQQFEATPAPGVPGFLFKVNISYMKGFCFSCADRLPELRFGRCWRCSLAWRLACRLAIPSVLADVLDDSKVCA